MAQNLSRYWMFGLLVVFVLAVFYVHNISTTYMISDEYLVYRFTRGTWPETIDYLANRDVHPPLWFSFFWVWRRIAGDSDFAGRMQAVLFSMLTLSVVYQLGKRWFSTQLYGLFSVIVLGITALFYHYSLEIRPYALALLLTSLSMLFFQRWLKRQTWRTAVPYAVTLAAILYVHYFLLIFILTQVIYFLFQRPSRLLLKQGIGVALLAFLLWLPWFPSFVTQFAHIRAVELASGDARGMAGSSVTTQPTSIDSIVGLVNLATNGQWLLYGLVLLLGLIYSWRKSNYRLALAWAVGVPLVAFTLNTVVAVYSPRYIVNFVIGLALVIAVGLMLLPSRLKWLALTLFVGISLWAMPSQLPRDIVPFQALFRELSAQAQPGDNVLLDHSGYEAADVMRWQLQHVVPEALRADTAIDIEKVLPARRIWHVTGDWLNPDVRATFSLIEQSHPRQSGIGKCDVDWCYLIQLMEAPPLNSPQLFGANLAFWGVDVDTVSPQSIQTRLWWKVENTLLLDFSIGLHLLDAQGNLIAQADGPINHYGQQIINTSQLEPGKIYIDFRTITLPSALPAGQYQLDMIVYDWQTGERLTLNDDADHLSLESITIP